MRTTREFYDYYGDLRGLQNQDISWLAKNCQDLEEAWAEGSPNIVIWLATIRVRLSRNTLTDSELNQKKDRI